MSVELGRSITGNIEMSSEREWLVSNGLGGYASGTISGLRTRRYHGLLVAALQAPLERTLLVGGVDAWVEIDKRQVPLSTHEWGAGVLFPDGYRHLEQFRLEKNIPTFRWSIGMTCIVQRIWMEHGANTSYITWHYERGIGSVRLILKPLVSYRSHHDTGVGGKSITSTPIPSPWEKGVGVEVLANEYMGKFSRPSLPAPFRILCSDGSFTMNSDWWWSCQLREEKARGLDSQEDLYQVGTFDVRLELGQSVGMVCTMEHTIPDSPEIALVKEYQRLDELQEKANYQDAPLWIQQLVWAADQFVVESHQHGQKNAWIISGYPWFSVWYRDMLAGLNGLTSAVGRPELAAEILRTCLHKLDSGMLPNTIDEELRTAHNSIDATLWYFIAVWDYLRHNPHDEALLAEVYPSLRNMLQTYVKGTRYYIGEDPSDGLLFGGENNSHLTWMDVKIDDRAITPRLGKAVEVNALWYNALRIMQDFAERLGKTNDVKFFSTKSQRVLHNFNHLFWCEEKGYLYDVIGIPTKPNDSSLRPNQLLALSLPFRVLENDAHSKKVVDICARDLLISYGMRTLNPDSDDYKGQYKGSPEERDQSYHQGTAWAWLLGHFISAYLVVYQDKKAALSLLEPFADHLRTYGVGSIAEIFEGNSPFKARGAIAQAWSVAEVLRIWHALNSCQDL